MLEHIAALLSLVFTYWLVIAALGLLALLLVTVAMLDRVGEAKDRRESEEVLRAADATTPAPRDAPGRAA
jgi:hypothetical protein